MDACHGTVEDREAGLCQHCCPRMIRWTARTLEEEIRPRASDRDTRPSTSDPGFVRHTTWWQIDLAPIVSMASLATPAWSPSLVTGPLLLQREILIRKLDLLLLLLLAFGVFLRRFAFLSVLLGEAFSAAMCVRQALPGLAACRPSPKPRLDQ